MKILIVDDHRDAADSLRMVLEAEGGHVVRVAYDGVNRAGRGSRVSTGRRPAGYRPCPRVMMATKSLAA